ncbi:hypothetical protein HPB50_020219 [Hyalomma asiaticum]|uniref:Uncharacterized protein n=1 Tax=Hyalomma asiaticum TaxID=266040 RepID=A0ACB7TB12_HYAAI|nr:hypothetical protein HPB50_020219 [Hyalomma asiaticum]
MVTDRQGDDERSGARGEFPFPDVIFSRVVVERAYAPFVSVSALPEERGRKARPSGVLSRENGARKALPKNCVPEGKLRPLAEGPYARTAMWEAAKGACFVCLLGARG